MVFGPLFRQLLVNVIYPAIKPIIKSHSDQFMHRLRKGIASGSIKNQFNKMFEEMAIKTGMKYPTISQGQAKRILGLDFNTGNPQPKIILNRYYRMVEKNDPKNGGSVYIQAKLFTAKQCLFQKIENGNRTILIIILQIQAISNELARMIGEIRICSPNFNNNMGFQLHQLSLIFIIKYKLGLQVYNHHLDTQRTLIKYKYFKWSIVNRPEDIGPQLQLYSIVRLQYLNFFIKQGSVINIMIFYLLSSMLGKICAFMRVVISKMYFTLSTIISPHYQSFVVFINVILDLQVTFSLFFLRSAILAETQSLFQISGVYSSSKYPILKYLSIRTPSRLRFSKSSRQYYNQTITNAAIKCSQSPSLIKFNKQSIYLYYLILQTQMSCFDFFDRMCRRIVSPIKVRLDEEEMIQREIRGFTGRYENFIITNTRGLKISGVFFINSIQTKPTILYLHGNGGSKMEMLPIIRADFAKNFNFCGIDFCGCGLSQGNTISYGIHQSQDIATVISYLQNKYRVVDIHLWGRSMGAVAAILFCHSTSISISSIVLDSPFPSLQQVISNVAEKQNIPWIIVFVGMFFIKSKIGQILGFDIFNVNYADILNKSSNRNIPILFGFSKNDLVVKPDNVQEMYDAYEGQKFIFQIESNHSQERPKEFTFEGLKFVFMKSKFQRR